MPERKPLSGRAELNVRAGSERSILMNEFWVPLAQDAAAGSVVYGDLRLMGDDADNREFNIGVGYRQMVDDTPVLGDGIVGVHGWVDRRITDTGSRFNQVTAGAEWMSNTLDLKLNTYLPLNNDKSYTRANPNPSNGFVGNQIVVSTDQTVVEEAMKGLDLELGWNALDIVEGFTDQDTGMDSARIYAGGYHFAGERADDITGYRIRAAADITSDIQLGARFTTANGAPISTQTLIAATSAPIITNAGANAVTVTADNVYLAGFTASGSQNGIVVDANGISTQNITITDVSTINNDWMGIYLHGYNSGSLSAKVQRSVTGSNGWHGMAVYDDTANTFDVDLGGGTMGSVGRNVLAGNTLEDLVVDYDGRALSAQNNWWGQATGPDQDNPSIGTRPQIYYGAPLNDGLVVHLTFDTEWTSGTTAYDRAGGNHNGVLTNGLNASSLVTAQARQGIQYDGFDDKILIPNDPDYETSAFTVLSYFSLLTDPDDGANNNWRSFLNMGSTSSTFSGWDIVMEQNRGLQFDLGNNNASSIRSGGLNVGLTVGTPIYIGFSYDNATKDRSISINGANFLTTNLPALNYAPNLVSSIGLGAGTNAGVNVNGNGYVHGVYDDFRVYDRALATADIAEIYRSNTSSSVSFSGFLTSTP